MSGMNFAPSKTSVQGLKRLLDDQDALPTCGSARNASKHMEMKACRVEHRQTRVHTLHQFQSEWSANLLGIHIVNGQTIRALKLTRISPPPRIKQFIGPAKEKDIRIEHEYARRLRQQEAVHQLPHHHVSGTRLLSARQEPRDSRMESTCASADAGFDKDCRGKV